MGKDLINKFNHMKISKRLLICFSVILLLTAVIMIFAIYFVIRVGSFSHLMYTGPYVITTEIETIRANINESGVKIRNALFEEDIQKYEDQITDVYTKIDQGVLVLQENFDGDKQLVADLENALLSLKSERQKIINVAREGNYEEAFSLLNLDYKEAFDSTVACANVLYQEADANAASFDRRAVIVTKTATIFLSLTFVITFLFAAFLSGFTTKSIVKPLRELEIAADEMAKGRLGTKIEYQSKNELGNLAESMREMVRSLNSYIKDISRGMKELAEGNLDVKPDVEFQGDFIALMENIMSAVNSFNSAILKIDVSANQVAISSDQVAAAGHTLSDGANGQSSAIEELSVTINEITDRIKSSADNADQARKLTGLVEQDIEESNRNMQNMVKAMQNISESSHKIDDIIKTIEGLAEQTNLLSLNASIEAARAGEAGKGFAVVAEEVGKLAAESAEASKNSTVLIKDSIKAVDLGMQMVEQTAASMLLVVENTKQVTETVDQISEDTTAQAVSMRQISEGVEEISKVIMENNSAIEESAASSEILSEQAEALSELVKQFKVKA